MLSIAFDCDGTLVDSEPLHNRADVSVLAKHGIVVNPDEHRRRSTGIGRSAMLRVIEQERRVKLPENTQEQIESELQRLVNAELQSVAGVTQVLGQLAQRGARMAVASNSHEAYIDLALRKCGIGEYFGNRIASADRVKRLKPAPDIYELAAELLDTPPSMCVAVEDSVAGVISASTAGMRTIAYCPPGHVFTPEQLKEAGARDVIRHMAELLTLVQ
jgi:HAD superfamily hydrolase (TIGR01509 family)